MPQNCSLRVPKNHAKGIIAQCMELRERLSKWGGASRNFFGKKSILQVFETPKPSWT
jgi:hypothetical protein